MGLHWQSTRLGLPKTEVRLSSIWVPNFRRLVFVRMLKESELWASAIIMVLKPSIRRRTCLHLVGCFILFVV